MSDSNGDQSFLHMIQAFLVRTLQAVREQLPDDAVVTTAGRTIVRGTRGNHAFGVRLRIGKHEDDMWPHFEGVLEIDGAEHICEVHPDRTASEHATTLIDALIEKTS